jgi:four helix bundle protein
MGARHFTDLEVWRLADKLRQHIFEISASGPASHDFSFRDQIRRSADSVCDNIAEGFGRYSHREFSRYLTIAKASLDENESQLLGGLGRRYLSEPQVRDARHQVAEVRRTLLALKRYLDRTDPPPPFTQS